MDTLLLAWQQHPAFFYTCVALLGAAVGSFLNVVIYRLPIMMERQWKQEYQEYFAPEQEATKEKPFNLALPASTCPKCQHKIPWYENIPLLSYLRLKGKCSQCSSPIGARYPMVEALTMLLSLVVALHFGVGWACLFALIFTWAMIALTFIDLDKMLLPDPITLPLLWLGLLLSTQNVFVDTQSSIIGASAGYLSLWSIYWGFKLLTGKEGMGYGDFKLFAVFGAWFGWKLLLPIILLSSLVGAMAGISLIVFKQQDRSTAIPFGPYLTAAGWIAMLWGTDIIAFYMNQVLYG